LRSKLSLSIETSNDFAFWLGEQEMVHGRLRRQKEILRELNAVAMGDITRVVKDVFQNRKLNLAVIGPYNDKKPLLSSLYI
jgi:predicted Zn-dependent peptidase